MPLPVNLSTPCSPKFGPWTFWRSTPRRSYRTSRPSARAADPNNAEAATTLKWKASDVGTTSRRAPKKRCAPESSAEESSHDFSESDPADNPMNGGDTEAEDTDGQDAMDVEEYHSFKAMADADHEHVCLV
jgi:hypothetical protein